jgi:hypothetical protein
MLPRLRLLQEKARAAGRIRQHQRAGWPAGRRLPFDLSLVFFGVAVDVVGGRVGNLAALFRSRF